MAYYTALITAWNAASLATGAALPSGTTGALLNRHDDGEQAPRNQ